MASGGASSDRAHAAVLWQLIVLSGNVSWTRNWGMDQRILLLYDESVHDALLRMTQHAGFELAAVPELLSALEQMAVADSRWLAVSAGSATAEQLMVLVSGMRELPEQLRPYVIVITDTSQLPAILSEGVDDLIHLPLTHEELKQKMRLARRFIQLQTEFRKQALRDPLTNVLNRRAVLDMLEREVLRSRRIGYPLAIAMVDLDDYKRVNDVYGHQAGDAAMAAFAARIESQLRPYDAVGRYGGDEFLVVLSNCRVTQGQVICERIRNAVASSPFRAGTHGDLALSLSAGLVAAEPNENIGVCGLIQQADMALLRAKRAGRNCIITAS